MKWYTCTPVSFKGDHTFFSRDSGAFCKAFQRIGVEKQGHHAHTCPGRR